MKQGGDVDNNTWPGTPCSHSGDFSYGDGWFNECTLIAQCATGVHSQPALEANQTLTGQAV